MLEPSTFVWWYLACCGNGGRDQDCCNLCYNPNNRDQLPYLAQGEQYIEAVISVTGPVPAQGSVVIMITQHASFVSDGHTRFVLPCVRR